MSRLIVKLLNWIEWAFDKIVTFFDRIGRRIEVDKRLDDAFLVLLTLLLIGGIASCVLGPLIVKIHFIIKYW